MTVPRVKVDVVMPRSRIPRGHTPPRKPGSLLGVGEIAELMGVSRQRVSNLSRRAYFPAPEVELKMGKVWRAEPIEEWLREVYRAGGDS